MPERTNGTVLKTVEGKPSVGSNPTLPARALAKPPVATREIRLPFEKFSLGILMEGGIPYQSRERPTTWAKVSTSVMTVSPANRRLSSDRSAAAS